MKYVITVIILFVFTLLVQADEEEPNYCLSIESTAGTIMEARQVGVPMAKVMKHTHPKTGDDKIDEGVEKIMKAMVMDAYKRPRFSSKEYQQNAILDFRNEWYLSCLEANDK